MFTFSSKLLFSFMFFIVYARTVIPVFPPCLPPAGPLPLLQAIPILLSMGHVCMFFGYSILYAVLYILMTIL